MNVKILRVKNDTLIDAQIIDPKSVKIELPSVTTGWRFNFNKQVKKAGFETYILVKEDTPDIIEGCLTFEMKNKVEPYMSFIEVAAHNQGKDKKYEKVAGCLIAFACRLSFKRGDGWLAFDVLEEKKEDEIKLMAMYSIKYGALRYDQTMMVIPPEGGIKLISEFLK